MAPKQKHQGKRVAADAGLASEGTKRSRARDIPQKAHKAMKNKLTKNQFEEQTNLVDEDGKCLQDYVEAEIIRQGGENFELRGPFWNPLLTKFGLLGNDLLADLTVEAEQPCREGILLAFEGLITTNNFHRGMGLKKLTAELDGIVDLNPQELFLFAQVAFDLGDASKLFQQKVQWLLLDFMTRNGLHLIYKEIWGKVVNELCHVAACKLTEDLKAQMKVETWVRDWQHVCGAWMDVAKLKMALQQDVTPEAVKEAIDHCSEKGGALATVLLTQAKKKFSKQDYARNVLHLLSVYQDQGAMVENSTIKDLESSCRRIALQYTAVHGRWLEKQEESMCLFLGQKTPVMTNDNHMLWKLPMTSIVKSEAIRMGALTPMPWEAELLSVTNSVVEEADVPELLQASNAARKRALELMGDQKQAFYLLRKEVLKHQGRLEELDKTFIVDLGWMNAHCQEQLKTKCYEEVLQCLPNMEKSTTLTEALDALDIILESQLMILAGPTVETSCRSVQVQVQAINKGAKPKPPGAMSNQFYKDAYGRFVWFYEFVAELEVTGIKCLFGRRKKILRGGVALRAALEQWFDMSVAVNPTPLPSKQIKEMKSYVDYFDADMKNMWKNILHQLDEADTKPMQLLTLEDDDKAEAKHQLVEASLGPVKRDGAASSSVCLAKPQPARVNSKRGVKMEEEATPTAARN